MAWIPNIVTIKSGEPAILPVILFDKNGELLNAAGASEIWIQIKKADHSVLEKQAANGFTWGIGLTAGFLYVFNLTADEVATLAVAPNQDACIKLVYGSVHQYSLYKKYLTVA